MVSVIESVQVVLFLNAPTDASALQLFRSHLGYDPASFQSQMPTQSHASAPLDGVDLVLATQPGRVDLILQPPTTQTPPPQAPGEGKVEAALATVHEAIASLISDLQVGRTATVAQGHEPAGSSEEALAKVRSMVPGLPEIPNMSDVNFQISQRKPSRYAAHRMIKRMVRWETAQVQLLELQVGAAMSPRVVTSGHVAHKYVDVFSELMESLTTAQAIESSLEVTDIAVALLKGSFNDLN